MDKFVELRKALTAELRFPGTSSSFQVSHPPQVWPVIEPLLGSAPMHVEEPDEEPTEDQPSSAVVTFKCLSTRLAKQLHTDEGKRRSYTIHMLRDMMGSIDSLPADFIVQTGVASVCMEILKASYRTKLESQAVTLLHQLAAAGEEYALVVVREGAVGPITHLLQSRNNFLAAAAAEVLGHIVGHGPSLLSVERSSDIVASLVALVNPSSPAQIVDTVAWILVDFCKSYGKLLSQQVIRLCVPALFEMISRTEENAAPDAFWTLKYFTCLSKETLGNIVDQVIRSRAVPTLMEVLTSDNDDLVEDCLQVFGKFVTSSQYQTQYFVEAGLLTLLTDFLRSPDSDILYCATLVVRNIASLGNSQTRDLVSDGFVRLLVEVVGRGGLEARKKAVSSLGYIAINPEDHIMHLHNTNVIPALCNMLERLHSDVDLVVTTLDTIEKILKTAKRFGHGEYVGPSLHDCGGLFGIERLQRHPNKAFRDKARDVLYAYAF